MITIKIDDIDFGTIIETCYPDFIEFISRMKAVDVDCSLLCELAENIWYIKKDYEKKWILFKLWQISPCNDYIIWQER